MKIAAILLACAFFTFFPTRAQSALDGQQSLAIAHLIQYVRESGLEFIRNNKSYTAAYAADHMQTKLGYAKERLSTAEEFIDYVASRSSITNKPYFVKTDGKLQELGPWLHAELNNFRLKK